MTAIHYPEPDFATEPPPPALTVIAEPNEPRIGKTAALIGIALVITVIAAASVWFVGSRPASQVVSTSGFAEMYVHTYLTQAGEGAESAIAPFLGYEPDLTDMTPGSFYVAGATALTADQDGATTRHIVAVNQLGAVDGGFASEGVRYYEVVVETSDFGVRALGLPSQVAAPEVAAVASSRPVFTAPVASPMMSAIESYLAWYLADGEGAYSGERPSPALYESLVVTGIYEAEPGAETVMITVAASDGSSRVTHLQYEVTVSNEGGMWVAGLGR